MRRSRRLRWIDVPRLLIGGVVGLAGLFGGRYRRTEGAHVLAIDDAGRILVVRTTYLGPEWMLPGGRVERTETPHDAAVRETREETGLDVRVARLVLIDAHRARDVSFVFLGRVIGGDLEPQLGEIAEAGWVDREEIGRMSPRLHRLLELVDRTGDGVAYVGLPAP
jgi:ADP-ribose pyrophosphatase YjhB (NUDIX family)